MLQSLMTLLITAIFVVHGLLGCCWKHQETYAVCDETKSSAEQRPCCCDHHRANQQGHSPVKPCELECQGLCTYLPPQKILIDAPGLANPFDSLAIIPISWDSRHMAIAFLGDRIYDSSESEPPLRLHLLHQVQLI